MPEKFDVIVVGAGLAGITTALALAREGQKVALFERGEHPGIKNMSGGVLHCTEALARLLPDFWKTAPIERHVTDNKITFINGDSSFSISVKDHGSNQPPYDAVSILRAKFDKWYAEKAQEAGVFLIPETVIDDLVWEDDRIVGIRARRRGGVVNANLVIAADGTNSLIAKKAGLRKKFSHSDFAVGAKELLMLPSEVIDERFGLEGDEGVAHTFIGSCTNGVQGGAFIYTNKNSLSLGIVARLSSLQTQKASVVDLLDNFKNLPSIKPIIKDATLKEYSGHLIPEGGIDLVPKLFGNGILVVGDAAGLVLSAGIYLEGMNFAIASGLAAAETAKRATEKGDFSKKSLSDYGRLLRESFVLKDLKTFRRGQKFMGNPRLYGVYPSVVCGVGREMFRASENPRKKMLALIKQELKGKITLWRLLKDLIQASRGFMCL